MNPHSLAVERRTAEIRVASLLEQLNASRSPSLGDHLIVLFIAAGVAGLAWFQGNRSFMVCISLMGLVFTIHGISEARVKRRMDLLVSLVHELKKQKPED